MADLEFAIAHLALRPGDRLVVRVQGQCSRTQEIAIKAEIEQFAPGVPVLVIEEGVELLTLGAPLDEPEEPPT